MPLVDPVYTGISLGDPANTCRIHWNITGNTWLKLPHIEMPLEKLWLLQPTPEHHWRDCNSSHTHTLICIIGTHWTTTGKPLETHWLPKFFLHTSVYWDLSSRHTGLPLNYHWLRVREVCITNWSHYFGLWRACVVMVDGDVRYHHIISSHDGLTLTTMYLDTYHIICNTFYVIWISRYHF